MTVPHAGSERTQRARSRPLGALLRILAFVCLGFCIATLMLQYAWRVQRIVRETYHIGDADLPWSVRPVPGIGGQGGPQGECLLGSSGVFTISRARDRSLCCHLQTLLFLCLASQCFLPNHGPWQACISPCTYSRAVRCSCGAGTKGQSERDRHERWGQCRGERNQDSYSESDWAPRDR